MTTVARLGHTFAQQIGTALVENGLRAIWTDPFVLHGEEFYAKDVRNHHKQNAIDGLLTFTVYDDARGTTCDVQVMVNVSERGA